MPDFSTFVRLPVIDGHVHHFSAKLTESLWEIMDCAGISAVSVMPVIDFEQVNTNSSAFHLKYKHPQRVRLFGALDYTGLLLDNKGCPSLAEQVDILQGIGCEGIKMGNRSLMGSAKQMVLYGKAPLKEKPIHNDG
jgi:hypothetical protein